MDVYYGKVEVKPVNTYPCIPIEIPGVLMTSDLKPDEANPIPTMSYIAAADRENAGLAQTPRVLQTTGVEPTQNIVDLIDADDDDDEDLISEVVHKVEDVPAN